MTDRITYIYTLNDPNTKEVRYVGKTINKLSYRLNNHIKRAIKGKTHKDKWICSLMKKGELPEIELIMETYDWIQAEQDCIRLFKSIGARLCNHTMGGDGWPGCKHTDEFKEKMSKRLKDNPIYVSPEKRKQQGKKQSEYLKAHPEKNIFLILNQNEEWRRAVIKKANKASIEVTKKEVLVVNEEKQVLKVFPSVAEAARSIQGNNSVLAACARINTKDGIRKKYKGYIFVYEVNDKIYTPKFNKGCSKKVKYVNLYSGVSKIYNSVKEVLKEEKLDLSLTTACKYAKLKAYYKEHYFEYI